ncbi:hypothetical protein QFE97_13800 [Bacillus subtilis]|nr:hypothetical protein QFE97_13800 [Bacillus subtilis]
MNLNDLIPAKYRKPVYAVYALVGVALGAIAQAYGGVDSVPEWHAIVTNVYLYVGGAFGLTAAANTIVSRSTGSDSAEELEPDDTDDEPLDDNTDDEEPTDEGLEALAAAEVDMTPPAEDYRPRH